MRDRFATQVLDAVRAAGGAVGCTDRRPWHLADTEAALLYAADQDAWETLHRDLLDGYNGPVGPFFRPQTSSLKVPAPEDVPL